MRPVTRFTSPTLTACSHTTSRLVRECLSRVSYQPRRCPKPPSRAAVTIYRRGQPPTVGPDLDQGVLPVDVAAAPDGTRFAIALPGNAHARALPHLGLGGRQQLLLGAYSALQQQVKANQAKATAIQSKLSELTAGTTRFERDAEAVRPAAAAR